MNSLPLYRKENHADSAKDEHGPMGESAEDDLKIVIETSSKCPEKQIFAKFPHEKTPSLMLLLI